MFIVLLWTETFTPPRAAQTRRLACEKQEVKQAAEAVCVSLINATQAQSTGRLMLHPKPELVQQTAAVGASMSKETVPLDRHMAGSSIASICKLAVCSGNLKSKGVAGCRTSRAVQSLPPVSFHNLH